MMIKTLRRKENQLDDTPGRIQKNPESAFTTLLKRKPINDTLYPF